MCVINELKFTHQELPANPFVYKILVAHAPWGWTYRIKAVICNSILDKESADWVWSIDDGNSTTEWEPSRDEAGCIEECNRHFRCVVLECIKEETAPAAPVKYPPPDLRCSNCAGKGFLGSYAPGMSGYIGAPKCIVCDGTGQLESVKDPDPDEGKPTCKRCMGKGTSNMNGVPYACPGCKGYGRVHDT